MGGVFTTVLDMTERVIEDRSRQVLSALASRTAEARHEEEVWRFSAETPGQHRSSVPFGFLYVYGPIEHQARLESVSAEADDDLHPAVIDCSSESIWRIHSALSEDCLVARFVIHRKQRLKPFVCSVVAQVPGVSYLRKAPDSACRAGRLRFNSESLRSVAWATRI